VLVADGAMGTILYSKGVFINPCCDELNLTVPELVRKIDPSNQYGSPGPPKAEGP